MKMTLVTEKKNS